MFFCFSPSHVSSSRAAELRRVAFFTQTCENREKTRSHLKEKVMKKHKENTMKRQEEEQERGREAEESRPSPWISRRTFFTKSMIAGLGVMGLGLLDQK